MRDVWFAVPGDVETLTGGYIYARRLIEELPNAGWRPRLIPLAAGYPEPSTSDFLNTRKVFEGLPSGAVVLVDGLAFGAMSRSILDGLELKFIALVHHPLALETGLSGANADRLYASEKTALKEARVVVTTGSDTAHTLATRYDVPGANIHVALPGTDPAARAWDYNAVPQLLTVATVTYRKGYDVLVPALRAIADLGWTSVCVGGLSREPETTAAVRALIKSGELEKRIDLCGEVTASELSEIYDRSSVFVLPSRHEGYGMAFAEALAHGLPIVACAAGAVTDTVPDDAGLLVPPDDPKALALALRRILTDDDERSKMATAAWAHGQCLPRWSNTAAAVAKALSAAAS